MRLRAGNVVSVRRGERGFTLLTVLMAIFLFGFGLLAILRSLSLVTSGVTQNQNVAAISTLSNAFWGVVQANPSVVTSTALPGTFSATNISSAPAPLQDWLYSLTDMTTGVPPSGLPGATATIEPFADAGGIGSGCTVAAGCTIKLTLTWTPVASGSPSVATRTQIFYYQFGL